MRKLCIGICLAFAAYILGVGLPETQTPPTHYYGIARSLPTGWILVDDANHTPVGLHSPYCMPDTGELRISYVTPLVTVGTAGVMPDETYAGRVDMGPSVGLGYIYVMFRTFTGTTIHCSSSTLQKSNSNIFVFVIGEIA